MFSAAFYCSTYTNAQQSSANYVLSIFQVLLHVFVSFQSHECGVRLRVDDASNGDGAIQTWIISFFIHFSSPNLTLRFGPVWKLWSERSYSSLPTGDSDHLSHSSIAEVFPQPLCFCTVPIPSGFIKHSRIAQVAFK